ncbi:MAG: efflux RND transporter periplasmic adaptor subunit [Gammaproteobacteria bacterium]
MKHSSTFSNPGAPIARPWRGVVRSFVLAALCFTHAAAWSAGYPVVFEAEERAVLSAERDGVLVRFDADVGQRVKKGSILARVDAGEPALMAKRAKKSLEFVQSQVENLKRLNARGLSTNEELNKAQMEAAVTQTDIDLYTRQIIHSRVHAPFNGIVVRRLTQPHEWVKAGQPVVELLDPDHLRVVGHIPSSQAVLMRVGSTHEVHVPDLATRVPVKVKAVTPAVDEQSNTVKVVWSVTKQAPGLLAGMKGQLLLP